MSRKISLHQMPKDREFLECFGPAPRHRLVQLDFSSIEDVVLAEFGRDPNMWKLYGPNAAPNCGYLFFASHIPSMADKVREHYDPDNDSRTQDDVDRAKKALKFERGVAKTGKLGLNYGAYPRKLQQTYENRGIELSLDEAQSIWDTFHRLFEGNDAFGERLKEEWRNTGGAFINGRGRIMCCHHSKLKDVVNRFCQGTAHDLLLIYLWHCDRLRIERGVHMIPWIPDFHDETIWEVPDSEVDAAVDVLNDALVATNDELKPAIPIKGSAIVADTLADIKLD